MHTVKLLVLVSCDKNSRFPPSSKGLVGVVPPSSKGLVGVVPPFSKGLVGVVLPSSKGLVGVLGNRMLSKWET